MEAIAWPLAAVGGGKGPNVPHKPSSSVQLSAVVKPKCRRGSRPRGPSAAAGRELRPTASDAFGAQDCYADIAAAFAFLMMVRWWRSADALAWGSDGGSIGNHHPGSSSQTGKASRAWSSKAAEGGSGGGSNAKVGSVMSAAMNLGGPCSPSVMLAECHVGRVHGQHNGS